MTNARLISKKIKSKSYAIKDIEEGLMIENKYLLFKVLYEIAKEKIVSENILDSLKYLALSNSGISDEGVGNFTIKVTACATLIKLGYEEEYNQLDSEQKKWVQVTLNDKIWKNI